MSIPVSSISAILDLGKLVAMENGLVGWMVNGQELRYHVNVSVLVCPSQYSLPGISTRSQGTILRRELLPNNSIELNNNSMHLCSSII